MDETTLRAQLHDEIERAQTPPRNDVDTVLAHGRLRRRARHTTYAMGAVAAAAAAVLSVGAVLDPDGSAPVAAPSASASDGYDEVIERLDTVTRSHVEGVNLRTDDIYPSDWNRKTPLPKDRWEYATDWHALYDVGGTQKFFVSAMYARPDEKPSLAGDLKACRHSARLRCEVDGTADSWTFTQELGYRDGARRIYWFTVSERRSGGDYITLARIGVHADSWKQARQKWAVNEAQLRAIAIDPELVIPEPVEWPPLKPYTVTE